MHIILEPNLDPTIVGPTIFPCRLKEAVYLHVDNSFSMLPK